MQKTRNCLPDFIMFRQFDSINKWLLLVLGFFIPISTALTNVALGLIIVFWTLDNVFGRFRKWISVLKSNPVAFMGLVIFLLHIAGVIYTDAGKEQILESIMDGVKFLFISMAMVYVKDKQFYTGFLFSFILAMAITLFLSYFLWVDMLPGFIPVKGGPQDCSIFHDRIKQNIFMACTAFIAAVWARTAIESKKKFLWGIFSFLAIFNVFFMVQGKTGHLILIVLIIYYFISWDRLKSVITGALIILCLGVFAWYNPSNAIFLRTRTAIEEIREWKYGKPAYVYSSSGLRLEFFFNSLKLIKNNPVFGTGTGSYKSSYNELIKNTGMNPSDNPHNDYLMTTVQFGFVGLSLLLGFFVLQWRNANYLEEDKQIIIARGFVLTMLCACMVSSPLQDNADGWFFAFMSALLFSGAIPRIPIKKGILPQQIAIF